MYVLAFSYILIFQIDNCHKRHRIPNLITVQTASFNRTSIIHNYDSAIIKPTYIFSLTYLSWLFSKYYRHWFRRRNWNVFCYLRQRYLNRDVLFTFFCFQKWLKQRPTKELFTPIWNVRNNHCWDQCHPKVKVTQTSDECKGSWC